MLKQQQRISFLSNTYCNEPILPKILDFFNERPATIFVILLKGKTFFHIPFFLFSQTGGGLLVKNVVKLDKLPIELHGYLGYKASFCFRLCVESRTLPPCILSSQFNVFTV